MRKGRKIIGSVFVPILFIIIVFVFLIIIKCFDYYSGKVQDRLLVFIIAILVASFISAISYHIFSGKDKLHAEKLLENLWLIILYGGISLELGRHFSFYITNNAILTFHGYIEDVVKNESSFIISVIFLSFLVDFIVIFFKEINSIHEKILNVQEKVRKYYLTVSKLVGSSDDEIAFLSKFWFFRLSNVYREAILGLRKQLSSALLKYESGAIETILPEIYVDIFFGRFTSDVTGYPIYKNYGHFGIMSGMVLALLERRVEIIKRLNRKNDDKDMKLIYFTTLTLFPDEYLKSPFFKENSFAKKQWNEFLKKYAGYNNSGDGMIKQLGKEVKLERVILMLENENPKIDGIKTADEWRSKINELKVSSDNNTLDDFINRLHPSPEDCKYYIFRSNRLRIDGNDVQLIDNGMGLFEESVPIDIFAIGMYEDDSIRWLGCIGGYLGGDPEYFPIAWLDQYIDSEKWNITKKYLDVIHNNSELFTNFIGNYAT